MRKLLPYNGLPEDMSAYAVFCVVYLPSFTMLILGVFSLVMGKALSTVLLFFLLSLVWVISWFVIDWWYSLSRSSGGADKTNQKTLSTSPQEHFKQFQPLIDDSLQVTPQGNWVGYGHQDKVSFVRAVTFCNFIIENNPRILQMSKNNEDIRIKLSELPQRMSSEPIKAIRSVHYGYAYIDPESDTMLRLSPNQESTPEREVFPITYLAGKDIPSTDQLKPEDTSILNLTEAVKSG